MKARFGRSRDPNAEELAKYESFLRKNLADSSDPRGSLETVLTAIYLSPEAMYRTEWGLGPQDAHGRRSLAPEEIAYALSYALFDSGPYDGGRSPALDPANKKSPKPHLFLPS